MINGKVGERTKMECNIQRIERNESFSNYRGEIKTQKITQTKVKELEREGGRERGTVGKRQRRDYRKKGKHVTNQFINNPFDLRSKVIHTNTKTSHCI